MLASPIFHAETYGELAGASWLVEDKYDGIRAQAHVRDGAARLFSRRLNDVSAPYPEIVAALPQAVAGDAILDGEILAMRGGRVLPFRTLQARLQRKDADDALLREVPVAYVAFDLLAAGDDLLLDEPLTRRRERLATLLSPNDRVLEAPYAPVDGAGADVNARFEAARARGNEGLVVKRADSPYAPGRRGKWWLKLKRELATLDVAVVAVEWGHGKRAQVSPISRLRSATANVCSRSAKPTRDSPTPKLRSSRRGFSSTVCRSSSAVRRRAHPKSRSSRRL